MRRQGGGVKAAAFARAAYVLDDGEWRGDATRRIKMPSIHEFASATDPAQTAAFAKIWTSLLKYLEQRWQAGDLETKLMDDLEMEGKKLIAAGIRPDFRWAE